jgi:hypothetical protein
MTDAENAALEWLDWCLAPGNCTPTVVAHADTLKVMLARPVLPEEPDKDVLKLMSHYVGMVDAEHFYRRLLSTLTAPRTKEVEIHAWAVVFEKGQVVFSDSELAQEHGARNGGAVVKLTGKATVPA